MKYIAIIDADEKPVSCEFIGCNGNVSPYLLGTTTDIKALEQAPCIDAINRQAVISTIYDNKSDFKNDFAQGFFADRIRDLPSVTPAEKVGRWIKTIGENGVTSAVRCSECGFEDNRYMLFRYCPNCGAKMKLTEGLFFCKECENKSNSKK